MINPSFNSIISLCPLVLGMEGDYKRPIKIDMRCIYQLSFYRMLTGSIIDLQN